MNWDWAFWIGGGVIGVGALALLGWALLWDRSRGRRRCPGCWYDMGGVPGLVCPECGRVARRERAFFNTRRKWRETVAAVMLGMIGWSVGHTPVVLRDGWGAAVPMRVLMVALPLFDERADEAFAAALTPPGFDAAMKSPRWTRLLILHGWARRLEGEPTLVRYWRSALKGDAPENALVVPSVASLLEHEDEQVTLWAHGALLSVGWSYEQFEPVYLRWLRHSSSKMRDNAMAMIGASGKAAESAIGPVRDAAVRGHIRDTDAIRTIQSILELSVSSDPDQQDLAMLHLLDDERWQVREAAAVGLGRLEMLHVGLGPRPPAPKLIEALWPKLTSEHPFVRTALVQAIAARAWTHEGWEVHAARLIQLLESDSDAGVRRACLDGVRGLEDRGRHGVGPNVGDRTFTLRAASIAFRDKDPILRAQAENLLMIYRGQDSGGRK